MTVDARGNVYWTHARFPHVTDASVEHLAKLPNLRKLYLGPAKLSATGRQRLATQLPKTVITPRETWE